MSLFLHFFSQWLRQAATILHKLWLEVTGTVFIGFAALGSFSLLKEWRAYQDGGSMWKIVAVVSFQVMMVSFGIYSFFRAKRVR